MAEVVSFSFWLTGLLVLVGLLVFLSFYWLFNGLAKFMRAFRFNIIALILRRLILPLSLILMVYFWQLLGPIVLKSFPAILNRFIQACFSFFLIFFFVRLIDALALVFYQRKKKPFPLPAVLHGFLLALVYITAFFIILRTRLDVNITPFLATSALLTAILGLAFQGVLSNIMAGLSLNFSRAFSRGDWVQVGSFEGVVEEMNWRETVLIDRASNLVILPNSFVAAEKVINFSRPTRNSALILEVKVNFENNPSLVLGTLLEAAKEIPEVLVEPEPQAFVAGYDHLGLSCWLKFWIKDFSRKNLILGEVGKHVWYKLQRQGVKLSLPLAASLREVLKSLRPEVIPGESEAEAEINLVYLLNSNFLRFEAGDKAGELILPLEELRALASRVKRETYNRGEVLFRQGEKGDYCFIVGRGKLRGEIVYQEKGKEYLSEFEVGEGAIVGEMSLLTGLPRTATVVVAAEAELLRITAGEFGRLLRQHPQLADILAEVVSERNRQNQEFLKKVQALSKEDIEKSCNSRSILARLRTLMSILREESSDGVKPAVRRPTKVD
ncbi:MAG: cyclic nucleotide-binding domain-containing protein [Candidatus Aminicenantales bacterium]